MSEESADQFDAYMEEGFSGTPVTSTPTETPEPVAEETPFEQPQEPVYRQITEDDYNKLISSAAAVDEIKATFGKQFDTAFGKIGGVERILKQLQDSTPSGEAVEITADDVEELANDYPELAETQLKVLQRVASKMRGTGGAVDDERIRQAVLPVVEQVRLAAVDQAKRELAMESLNDNYEGWQDVVGLPDAEGNAPQTEFRKWLDTQPQEYKAKVLTTYSASTIGKAIDNFRESKNKLIKDAERRDRMAQAVTPKGDGGHKVVTTDDEESGFSEGFKTR